MNSIVNFKHLTISLLLNHIVFFKVGETGVPLQLVPFKESSHAVRLVPNTLELNEIIDRFLEAIGRLSEVENNNPLPINGTYKHFTYKISNQSISGGFQTDLGYLWGLTDSDRLGNAYIYNNEEDSIQVVTGALLNRLKIVYEQCNLTYCGLKELGTVEGMVDESRVDVRITLRARQNNSLPLIFVCDGKVDELSITPGDIHFTLTAADIDQEFLDAVSDSLADHFNRNVIPHLRIYLTAVLESVVRRDEQLCYSLVLCNSCEFYAADS